MSSRCARNGMLVGVDLPLLEAECASPVSEDDIAAGRIRGCNRIVCTRCSRSVKNFPGHYWASGPGPQELEEAYDRNDFSRFLGSREFFAKYRAYACRCDFTSAVVPISLLEVFRELEISWICEGHPGRRSR